MTFPDAVDAGAQRDPHREVLESTQKSLVGLVGSPSSTAEVTVDIVEAASGTALLGDMVYTSHPLSDGCHLLAIGNVAQIETRNRWHEDPNMRGVLRIHGALPHLSADGDVRTAQVAVQAVYRTTEECPPFTGTPEESGGGLAMSPTTGRSVYRVDEGLVDALIARHRDDVVYLGRVYRTDVRLPMYVRSFTDPVSDGAYHTGVFGRSGSGKTALATYLIASLMRHRDMSFFVFDPQGQFTHQRDMVLRLRELAESQGRSVKALSIASEIRLPKDSPLFAELLDSTNFFRLLSMKSRNENREVALSEIQRLIQGTADWTEISSADLLRVVLVALSEDGRALERIYAGLSPRKRLIDVLVGALEDEMAFEQLLEPFTAIHSLFGAQTSDGRSRWRLTDLIAAVLEPSSEAKPYVVVDLSASSGTPWLDSDETKAKLIRKIASRLRQAAEEMWRDTGDLINCAVVFDEAARFASAAAEGEEASRLSARLVEYVRETRKTGLGWIFITQQVTALHPAIYAQLTLRAFGYGLTTGSDLSRIREEIGHGPTLDLYKSFPDPKSLSKKVYPFMLTGPASPLSFTAAPVFLEVFTSKGEFRTANGRHFGS